MLDRAPLLPNNWQEWIAKHKSRNIADGEIVNAMIQQGIDIRIATAAVKEIIPTENNNGDRAAEAKIAQLEAKIAQQAEQLKTLKLQLDLYYDLEQLEPNFGKVERRSGLSRQEFLENYYAKNRPVILTDIVPQWKAHSRWTPDYLKEKYGHLDVSVQYDRDSNPLYEIEKEKHQKTMKLGEYADLVVNGGKTNQYYMVPFNANILKDEFQGLFEDVQLSDDYFDCSLGRERFSFWFGPEGTITPLHFDLMNSFLCQVYGRKRMRLISPNQKHLMYNYMSFHTPIDLDRPDFAKYPLFKNVNVIDVMIHPGEAMFVPAGWWHHVTALDITISLSVMNFIFPNGYDHLLSKNYEI